MHVAILGDGTLNNRPCCQHGPSLAEDLEARLGGLGQVTVLASRGMPLEGLPFQIALVPDDATHAVVAVGLEQLVYGDSGPSSTAAVGSPCLEETISALGAQYRSVIADLRCRGLDVVVVTVPAGEVLDPRGVIPGGWAWLDGIHQEITDAAADMGIALLDIREVLSTAADFHGTEGPSETGGRKVAEALLQLLGSATGVTGGARQGRGTATSRAQWKAREEVRDPVARVG